MNDSKASVNQRRKPKQSRALAKYNAVLKACTQVLAEYGYEKTTILELSLASDVAVPTIYQYFESKESIFIAWLDNAIDQILDNATHSLIFQTDKTINDFINSTLQQAFAAIDLYRESIQKLLVDLPHILVSHALTTAQAKTATALGQMVAGYIDDKQAAEFKKRLNILMQCILGFVLQRIMIEDRETLAADSEEISILVTAYLGEFIDLRTIS